MNTFHTMLLDKTVNSKSNIKEESDESMSSYFDEIDAKSSDADDNKKEVFGEVRNVNI